MKPIFLAVLFVLTMVNSPFAEPALRGPKIYGLQLGMTREQVMTVVNDICKELGERIKINNEDYIYVSGNKEEKKPSFMVDLKNNMVSGFCIVRADKLFQIEIPVSEIVIKQFMKFYKIPKFDCEKDDKNNIEHYYFDDLDKMFRVIVSLNAFRSMLSIKVEELDQPKFK